MLENLNCTSTSLSKTKETLEIFFFIFLFQDALEKPTNLNLYPKKRELERGIEETEAQLARKKKELGSLQQMVATYKSNPKFGSSKGFQVKERTKCFKKRFDCFNLNFEPVMDCDHLCG